MTKQELLNLIEHYREAYPHVYEHEDPHIVVYEDGPWSLKDILGHIADSNKAINETLAAHEQNEKKEWDMPEDFDKANQERVDAKKEMEHNMVLGELFQTLEEMKVLIDKLEERLEEDLDSPFGSKKISEFVQMALDHQKSHLEDIENFINKK